MMEYFFVFDGSLFISNLFHEEICEGYDIFICEMRFCG